MPSLRNLNVLVIDDSEIARVEMADLLSRAGFAVTSLASPIGATRAIFEHSIDVVVIDVQMPSIRGDRLAALFRGSPRFASLGVVLVTGGDERLLAELARTSKANAVLSKTYLSQLVDTVVDSYEQQNLGRLRSE